MLSHYSLPADPKILESPKQCPHHARSKNPSPISKTGSILLDKKPGRVSGHWPDRDQRYKKIRPQRPRSAAGYTPPPPRLPLLLCVYFKPRSKRTAASACRAPHREPPLPRRAPAGPAGALARAESPVPAPPPPAPMHLCDCRGKPGAGTAVRPHPPSTHPSPRRKGTPAAKRARAKASVHTHPPVPACPRPPPPPFAGSPLPHRRCHPHLRRGIRLPAGRAPPRFPRNVPKSNPPSLKPRTAGQPPSRVGAAPTARPPRPRSPSLPGLARRLRSAAHSSSGRRHVRPGAGAPARPAQPPVPRGPIPPPLSAWGGGSPPALPARVGSGRDGAGWQRGCTRSAPLPSSRRRDWGGRGRGWGGGPAPQRRRPRRGGPAAVATVSGHSFPRASRSPGSSGQRAASVRPEGNPWQPPMAVRGSGRQRRPCEPHLQPAPGTRGTPDLPAASTDRGAKTYTHSPEPGKPRSHKPGKPERKAQVSKDVTNSVMMPIER